VKNLRLRRLCLGRVLARLVPWAIFVLSTPGGVIPLGYTVVGRGDFSGLPERVLEIVYERHFAVYFKDGVWWVEDLGSRHSTYLNGVRVRREA